MRGYGRSGKVEIRPDHAQQSTVWRPWANDLTGASIESGHHMAEENPAAFAEALHRFLT